MMPKSGQKGAKTRIIKFPSLNNHKYQLLKNLPSFAPSMKKYNKSGYYRSGWSAETPALKNFFFFANKTAYIQDENNSRLLVGLF